MKKLILPLFVLVLLSASCGRNADNFSSTNNTQGQIKVVTSPSNITEDAAINPLTYPDDVGTFAQSQPNSLQIYTNNNLKIQLTVPGTWRLDKIYDKNKISFVDTTSTSTYSVVFQINYYKDFATWSNSDDRAGDTNTCGSIKNCYQTDGDFEVHDATLGSNISAVEVDHIAGEATVPSTFVAENNGIFVLGYAPFSNSTSTFNVLKSVKFLK